jgi:hypothetical protein
MRSIFIALLIVPSLLHAGGHRSKSHKSKSGPVSSAKDAKSIAEQDTGGRAVSAHRISLNGASCGWEVEVRMPHEERGWRCVIDCDTRMVHTKTRIDQPKASRR